MNKIIISLSLVFGIIVSIVGQEAQSTKNSADQTLRSNGRVNPSSLGLEMSIPLGGYAGRGISLPMGLNYSSKLWRLEERAVWVGQSGGDEPTQGETRTFVATKYSENAASGWTTSISQPYIEYTEAEDLFNSFDNPRPGYLVPGGYDPPGGLFYVKRITVHLPEGSFELRAGDTQIAATGAGVPEQDWNGIYKSVDGSGIIMVQDSTTTPAKTYRLYMPDGSFYDFNDDREEKSSVEPGILVRRARRLKDASGNFVQFNAADTTYPNGSITDTVGRTFPVMVPTTAPQIEERSEFLEQEFVLPGMTSPYVMKWKRLEDSFAQQNYELHYSGHTDVYQLQFPNSYSPALFETQEYMSPCTGDRMYVVNEPVELYGEYGIIKFNPVVLTEIELPNGAKYEFLYNEFGEVETIRYPTGGREVVSYDAMPSLAQLSKPYQSANRGVVRREIYESDTDSTPDPWTYHAASADNTYRTSVIASDGTQTDRFMHRGVPPIACGTHPPGEFPSNEYGLRWGYDNVLAGRAYDERVFGSNDQIVQRTITRWDKSDSIESDAWMTASPLRKPQFNPRVLTTESITYDGGSAISAAVKVEYHDGFELKGSPMNVRYKKEYAYKVVTAGTLTPAADEYALPPNPAPTLTDPTIGSTLVRNTETTYNTAQAYKDRNLLRIPIQIRIIDSSNNEISKSEFVCDEAAYFDGNYSTTNWENPNSTIRGNITTSRTWFKDSNTWIESHTMYDNLGNVRKVWDTSGDPLRFVEVEYGPVYKYAYPTKTKAPGPDPTAVHGTADGSEISRIYDLNTGLLMSVTDSNGQIATTEYDNLLRPIRINPPAGGSVSETVYNDTPNNIWVKSRQQIDEHTWTESTTFYDNLGRAFKTRTKDSQGDVMSQVKFDSFGRVEKTSNPYRVDANGNPTETVYWSKLRYDERNRVVETFAPAPEGQTGISLGTAQFGISTLPNLIGTYATAIDPSGRKSRAISGIYGLMRVDEATSKGGTIDQDLGMLANPTQPTYYNYNLKGEMIKITQGAQNRYFMYDSLGRLIRIRQPEQTPNTNLATSGNPENNQWTAGYTYDVLGNVVSVNDAKNIAITNYYDKAGRTTKRTYSDGTPEVQYFYDGKGLPQAPQFSRGAITKVTSSVSEDRFTSFDNHGRLLASQQITDGQTYNFGYKYNLSGGLVEETYPSGRIIRNHLDNDGGLSVVNTKAANGLLKTVASNFDYTATGGVRKMKLGNGLWETSQFNELNQLTQVGLGGNSAADTGFWKTNYDYGDWNGSTLDPVKNNGSVARQTILVPTIGAVTGFTAIQTYTYDKIDRLKSATETIGGGQTWKQTFVYDRFGNKNYDTTNSNTTTLGSCATSVCNPSVSATNKNQLSGYGYDPAGNITSDAESRTFTYDAENRQITATGTNLSASYGYDGNGKRVKSYNSITDQTTIFVYDAEAKLAAEYTINIPAPTTPTISYLTEDALGSPRVVTNSFGEIKSRRDFFPFGEEIWAGYGSRNTNQKYSSATDNTELVSKVVEEGK